MKNNVGGYNLVEVEKDIWFIHVTDGESYGGTFKEVVLFAILKYNFKFKDIELAVQAMLAENHNAAHFGMWGTFIFSYEQKYDMTRKAC